MKRLLVAIALGLSIATPGNAQLAPGVSGFSSAPTNASEAEYWRMIRRLGVCLADAKHDQAVAFIETDPGSAAEDEAFAAIFHRSRNRCMGNFVNATMLRNHVRGSVAEGLLNLMDDNELNLADVTPDQAPDNVRSIHEFAYCYVANHPSTAFQFLEETRVGTKGEIAAMRQMAPDFGPCLPNGITIEINPVNMRAAIAEAYYRLVMSMPPAMLQGS